MSDQAAPDLPQPTELSPPMRGGIWNARRLDLNTVLAARDATVGDLYRRAVDALGERPLTPGALVVASHCIRELANRLPRVLGEVEIPEYRSDRPAIAALEAALAEAGLSTGSENDAASDEPDDAAARSGLVPVPETVLVAALDVIEAHRSGSSRAHEMRSALVLGAGQAGGSASTVRLVKAAVNAFERFRHPLGDDLSSWVDRCPDYYVGHLEVIEQALHGRLGRFFDVVADLRAVLDETNEQANGQWVEPRPTLVQGVLPRLADPQHRRVFFHGLGNPLWISPLDAHGVFSDPPKQYVDDDGRVPFQHWPQGDYLRAMAPAEPDKVAAILARVVDHDTAWSVRENVIAVASEVPPAAAAQLVGSVMRTVEDRQVGVFLGTEVVAVVEVLAHGTNSQRRKAKALAQKLLEPRRTSEDQRLGTFDVGSRLDPHWYEEALGRVVAAFDGSLEILKSLVWWLDKEQALSGTFDPGGHDWTSSRRPSVSDHVQNHRFDDIANALIETVRDTSISLIATTGPEPVLDVLRSRPATILTRIELYALAQTARNEDGTPNTDALALAGQRLTDPDLAHETTCIREFGQLAAAALPLVDDITYARWEQALFDGPVLDDPARERIASFHDEVDPDEAVTTYIERSQLHRLSAAGTDALRARTLARYDELVSKHGEIDHPGFLTWHTSGWGDLANPTPDLAATAPREVIDLLAQPADEDDAFSRAPVGRREALARAFEAAVSGQPRAYSALTDRVLTLEAPFVNRFLSAMRGHVSAADRTAREPRSGNGPETELDERAQPVDTLDWSAMLTALKQSDVWHEARDTTVADVPTWRWVREEVCSVLEAGAAHVIPRELLPAAFDIAATMTTDSDPTPETEARYGGTNMEPLTHSLNAVRPSAVRTALEIVRADIAARQQGDPGDGTRDATADRPASSPLLETIVTHLTGLLEPERDHSLTIAAVLGEYTGWLIAHASGWLDEHGDRLMSPDPFGDVFVTATLASHYPHPILLELLTPAVANMLTRIAAGAEVPSAAGRSETPAKLIGNHLSTLYLWGRVDLDHPLMAQFFADAPVAERAALLDRLGWQFSNAGEIDEGVKDRAAALWDHRLAAVRAGGSDPVELAKFESWIRCGHYDPTWWLPRLTELAENYTVDGRAHIGDELTAAAAVDLPGTLHALDLLVRSASRSAMFLPYGVRRAAPEVIARALDSEDPAIATKADDLLNYLGRHGDHSIQEEVQEQRHQATRPGVAR